MTGIQFAKSAGYLLILIAAVQAYHLHSQPNPNAQTAPSLQQFFEGLLQHYDPSSLPKFEDVLKVTDRIAGARPEDITNALPSIFQALAHQDDNVKIDAAFALTVISRRLDSARLLQDYIERIGNLFDSSDPRLQGTPAVVFLNLKPAPPQEVVPLLLAFLKRTDRDPQAQGSAVFALVRIAPDNLKVVAAIQEFLARPLDKSTRIGVLNALGNPNANDPQLIAAVMSHLEDADPGIRFTAVQTIMRIGQPALERADRILERLANAPNQPPEVRDAAKEALAKLHPNK